MLLGLVLFGCTGDATEPPPPEPVALLTQAAANIRQTDTFRMTVERTGRAYYIQTDYGGAEFRRADVQYAGPDIIQARVRVVAAGLPIDLEFFFRDTRQWLRGIWTNNAWVSIAFAPGFSPAALMAAETGFQAAINALTDLQMIGRQQLVDGTPVYHVKAQAQGEDVSDLMAGLIEVTGRVMADVFVHRDTLLPVRFVIVQPDSVIPEAPEPTTWTIEVYDFDQPAQLDIPAESPAADAEATPEATAAS